MKTLITKTGKLIDLTPKDERPINEIMETFYKTGSHFFTPVCEPIEESIEIKVSDDTFKFIESVANIETEYYGDKTYVINNIKFKVKK